MSARPAFQSPHRRRFERFELSMEGIAAFPAGVTTVRVMNLSQGGARIALPLPYAAYGASIRSLRLPGVATLTCARRWNSGPLLGLEFTDLAEAQRSLRPLLLSLKRAARDGGLIRPTGG